MLSFGAAVPLGGHSDMRLQLLNGFEHDIIVAGKRNPPAPLGSSTRSLVILEGNECNPL